MKYRVEIPISDGPGQFQFFTQNLPFQEPAQLVLEMTEERGKCSTIIYGMEHDKNHPGGNLLIKGEIEIFPKTKVPFKDALYNTASRTGMLFLEAEKENGVSYIANITQEIDPYCGHQTTKGSRYCDVCHKDRTDVG